MQRTEIALEDFSSQIYQLFSKRWFLLTCGDFSKGHFNTMTIEWGSIGEVWNQPLVQVFVRPSRYTFQFMEQYDSFTLSCLPENLRSSLLFLGSKSGRDGDKIAASGLTPVAASQVASPVFAEAELTIECTKMYWADIINAQIVDHQASASFGHLEDAHRQYFGRIVSIQGTSQFLTP